MIGANVTEGETVSDFYYFFDIPSAPYGERYINETIDLENPNETRATNVIEYDINLLGADYHYLFYWDKATGMRVYYENSGVVPELVMGETTQPAYNFTVKWELVDSSVDGLLVPDLTGPLLLLMTMAITIPIVILHRRKKITHLK